ncbi:hypothetical protein [Lysinibacillus sp. RS5]|uniref:hypothetical protein n=1 Tax=unclassified Lysinibacillus TaxID=2636778 RepID=UPI0035BE192D
MPRLKVDWSGGWATPRDQRKEERRLSITSCDNAFVTNIVLARDPAAKRMFSVRKRSDNVAAATGFCLCESEAGATTKAAHRTPPGKRPVGTEINHTL